MWCSSLPEHVVRPKRNVCGGEVRSNPSELHGDWETFSQGKLRYRCRQKRIHSGQGKIGVYYKLGCFENMINAHCYKSTWKRKG